MKVVTRLLLAVLLVQMSPWTVWAQQAQSPLPQGEGMSQDQVLAIPDMPPGIHWTRLGADPLIPASLLPADYGQDKERDRVTLQNIILGADGFQAQHDQFWNAANMVFFLGKGMDPVFEQEFKNAVRIMVGVEEFTQPETTMFNGPMAWGYRNINGRIESRLSGPALVGIPGGVDIYLLPAIQIKSGPFAGHWVNPVVPKVCINLTFLWATNVPAAMPVDVPPPPPAPEYREITVKKEWKRVNGRNADTPDRSVLQLAFRATPTDGGEPVQVEAFNNREVEMDLELGKEYRIEEVLQSSGSDPWANWRPLGASPVTITVAEDDNEDVVFQNMEIPPQRLDLSSAVPPPPPPPVVNRTESDHELRVLVEHNDRTKKWMWIGIAAGVIGGIACWKACRPDRVIEKEETIIVQEPVKGETGPGSSPASEGGRTAGFSFSFGF